MIDILNIYFWIFVLLLASAAGLTGYFYARLRFKRHQEELTYWEDELRRQSEGLQRLSYQESNSRLHQVSDRKTQSASESLVEQLKRDYSILEQEAQFEQRLYREENQALREELAELKGTPIDFRGALGRDLFEDAKEIEQLDEERNGEPPVAEELNVAQEAEEQSIAGKSEELSMADEAEPQDLNQPNFEEFEFHWSDEPDEMEEKQVTAPEEESAVPSQDAFPVFRAFSDFVPQNDSRQANSPVSSFESFDSFTNPLEGSPSTIGVGQDVGMKAQEPAITSLIGLSTDQFALLSDLGYASSEKRARLSPAEISRLSEIFRIPADFIRSNWMK